MPVPVLLLEGVALGIRDRGATVRAGSPVASTRCYLLALTQVPAKSHLHYRNQRLRDLKDSDTLLSSLVSHRKADIGSCSCFYQIPGAGGMVLGSLKGRTGS